MTDAEVMKNTRCCADNYCKNCSLQGKPNCKNMLLSFAWNTMYNQKEENDRQKAEIERLKKENNQFADIGKMYSEIKVETVKKFKNTIRVLFRLEFLRRKRYDKIFDEAEAIMLKGIAGDTE